MRARSKVSCRCRSTACSDSDGPMQPMVSEAEPPGAKTKFIHVAKPRSRRTHCAERAALGASAASLPRRGRWLDAGCCAATCGLCGFSAPPARFVRVSRAVRRLGVSIEARAHSARTVETGWTCSNAARSLPDAVLYPFLLGQHSDEGIYSVPKCT